MCSSDLFQLERFHDHLAMEKGASPRTNEAYLRDVARFATFCLTKGATAPATASARVLREYVYHLKDLGLSPSSIRRNVSAVRSYFRFMIGEGELVRDPSEKLEAPKKWRSLPEVLTVDEAEKLLQAPSLDEPLAFRDRAMLELAYGAGLRVSEWISLGMAKYSSLTMERKRISTWVITSDSSTGRSRRRTTSQPAAST